MRQQGQISSWNNDRGFGFITPSGGGDHIFVHISAFANRSRRPIGDEIVAYNVTTDVQGRPQASAVSFVDERVRELRSWIASVLYAMMIAGSFLTCVAGLAVAERLPVAVPALYMITSAIAFGAYGQDKLAARRGRWRTAESTLHLLSLWGGWPGALVARYVFRHKSRKQSFIAWFWASVVLNCGVLAWLFSSPGQQWLSSLRMAA